MSEPFGIPDVLAVARRRWLIGLAPLAVGAPLAALVALGLPPVYESTGRILVEAQQIPEDLVRSTVTSGPAERIRLIEQRLTTRAHLLDVARRFEVFADQPDLSPTAIVDAMRGAVAIRSVALATQGRGQVSASAIEISFRADNPVLAARVANDFVTRILSRNVEDRSERASDTLAFFSAEAERLGAALAAAEAAVTRFKTSNQDALPDGQEFRRAELSRAQERIFEREARIVALEEQLRLGSGSTPGAPASAAQGELNRLNQLLARQQSVYAESHPVLRQTRAQIAALTATIGAEESAEADEPGADAASPRSGAERQIAQLRSQNAEDLDRIEALRRAIERTPEVEVALATLERDADSLRRQYDQTVLKQAEAALGERLEVNRQAERFELIERPEPAAQPVSPNRPVIIAGGVFGAAALGAGLVLLIELLNRRIYSPRDLERATGLTAMTVVGVVRTAAERRWRLWTRRVAAVAILAAVPVGVFYFDRNVAPVSAIAADFAAGAGLDVWMATLRSRFAD